MLSANETVPAVAWWTLCGFYGKNQKRHASLQLRFACLHGLGETLLSQALNLGDLLGVPLADELRGNARAGLGFNHASLQLRFACLHGLGETLLSQALNLGDLLGVPLADELR